MVVISILENLSVSLNGMCEQKSKHKVGQIISKVQDVVHVAGPFNEDCKWTGLYGLLTAAWRGRGTRDKEMPPM